MTRKEEVDTSLVLFLLSDDDGIDNDDDDGCVYV
jgi:hypothetical protein